MTLMDLSVVIPCYRSKDTLPELVGRLHRTLPGLADRYEILLVVDGSPDDTYTVARRLEVADEEHVHAILLARNYGQHSASLAGIVRAKYPITVLMDDDLQHRPEEINKLLTPLADPLVDVVYGVAVSEEHGFFRNLTSQGVKRLMSFVKVPHAADFSSFVAFRTPLREGFAHVTDAATYLDVLLSWTTTGVARVDVEMDQRTQGRSGYTWGSLFTLAWDMMTGYSLVPLKLVTYLGLVSFLIGLSMFVVVLVQYALAGPDVVGWASLAAMTASFSGVIMLSLGIIGEYLGRLHFRSMQRPTYVVRVDPAIIRSGSAGIDRAALVSPESRDTIAAALHRKYATPQD